MTTLISTDQSFLKVYPYDNIELLKKCAEENRDKLTINPFIILHGNKVIQHRNIGFFSDESKGYYYSGQLTKSMPLTDNLKQLLLDVNTRLTANFNGILMNEYKDGHDYIGQHSDEEKYLDKIGVVSLSYGAVRKFRIYNKSIECNVQDILTSSDEMIHMGGKFQKEFKHGIPQEKKIKEYRISFTFRKHNE